MKLVRLIDADNKVRYINPDHIALISPEASDSTTIYLSDHRVWVNFNEAPEEIVKRIEGQLKPTSRDFPL